ncbi:hypothetical protein EVAR_26947_1 [Eumeta japonica]|uniref:Reverse transcriptase domain-containing protein n=1 Tax=Eumeta variegata TaxID=151549 RepID=A0A4C1VKT5_EUMVA|nr:hypothetical protein EVAR_26947_1 [Eumeta japonica]
MNDSVTKRGIKVNVDTSKVMVFERDESTTECNILIKGEKVEQVKEFVYLGSLFTNYSKHDIKIERRVNAENKANEALLAIINNKNVSRQARLVIHNGFLISMFTYGSENCVWQKKNESKINAVEMRSLRSICGVSQKHRCRNSDDRGRCDLKEDVVTRLERVMFRWFGHLERIVEIKLTKKKSIERMCVMEKSARVTLEHLMETTLMAYKKRAKF